MELHALARKPIYGETAPSAGHKSDSQGGTAQQYCLEVENRPKSFPVIQPIFRLLTQEIHFAQWGSFTL